MTSENIPTSSPRSSNGPWQPPALEEIQALFPQYEIVALLGRGGMGAVYKGWQRSLDRFVAIKILPQGLKDDPQYSERFKQEAKSMAKLAHAGIVAVFDAGELANGMLYFVMEFIEGTDVQKMIAEQGILPPAHAMAITAHVCDALQYAHDRGIIHRDIKPANIMVGYDGVVKVADFGLAKQQQEGVSGLTQSGMVMGTLHYMAPESLILGVSVDHRADIYAVGIMLYQMLTGRLPQGLFEMPSQKVPGLDPRYDAVVAKAIREDRDIRYQSAAELRADLDSILTQPVVKVDPAVNQAPAALPTVARPQRPQGMPRAAQARQMPQPVEKKNSSSLGLVAAGVVAVVLAAGAFVLFKGKDKGAPPPPAAGTPVAAAPKADVTMTVTDVPAGKTGDAGKAAPSPAAAAGNTKPPPPQAATKPLAVPAVVTMTAVPKTELEQRVAALESGFQTNAKGEPESTYRQNMAALDKSYLAAIERALAAATKDARLDDAVALREEKQRVEKGVVVPAAQEEADATVPVRDAVKKLRDTYRTTQHQHATAKAKAVAALYDKYDLALAALQADLTKAKKLDDALLVKPLREQIKARKEAALALKPIAAVSLASLGITNSLGMRLVPVSGTEVLMCVHETRRQDFAVFAQETGHGDNAWKNSRPGGHATASGHEDGHPVVGVTWEQAVAFCDWLSKREGLAYRLPSDWEWSMAAGLSEPQSAPPDRTPQSLSGSTPDRYPWGSAWPPPPRAGNFQDLACWKDMAVPDFDKPDYEDGFPTTAPVMNFPPNSLGIFDLAGNVTEWCSDWYDAGKTEHVSRGSAWYRKVDRGVQSSSFREHSKVGFRNNGTGFRVVVKNPAAAPPAASLAVGKPAPAAPAAVSTTPAAPVMPPATAAAPAANRARASTVEPLVSQAVFFATTGQVSVTGKDGSANDAGRAEPPPQGAAVVTSVSAGGTVKTGPKSSAALALVGGGSVQLDADSEMIFSAVNEGRPAVESLELRKGRLFIHVEAADLARMGRASLLIKTPVGTAAVQGGKCYVEIGASYETIGVFKGLVEVMETQSGSKAVVKDEMTLAAKAGRLSPPQRLAMAQTALRKVCDQIELVRTELSLMPLDDVLEKTLEDVYFYLGNNQRITLEGSVSAAPVISSTKASGTLLVIKPNQPPKLRSRTIGYSPKIDLTRFKPEILAVEFGCRSDGVEQLEPDLQGHDPDSGLFDIIPFGANYIYYVGRRVHMQPGTGKLGEWTNRIYPMFPPTSGPKLKFIRAEYRVCVKEDESYLVPGRQEYRLEISPLVVITRKQQP